MRYIILRNIIPESFQANGGITGKPEQSKLPPSDPCPFNLTVISLILTPRFFTGGPAKCSQHPRSLGCGFQSRQIPEILLFSKTSRPGLRPKQAPTQWVPGFFSGDGRGVNLTTHVYLLQRLKMDGANPLFYMPSLQGKRYRTPHDIPICAQRGDEGTSPTHTHPPR
jgi:hypothetical protein